MRMFRLDLKISHEEKILSRGLKTSNEDIEWLAKYAFDTFTQEGHVYTPSRWQDLDEGRKERWRNLILLLHCLIGKKNPSQLGNKNFEEYVAFVGYNANRRFKGKTLISSEEMPIMKLKMWVHITKILIKAVKQKKSCLAKIAYDAYLAYQGLGRKRSTGGEMPSREQDKWSFISTIMENIILKKCG